MTLRTDFNGTSSLSDREPSISKSAVRYAFAATCGVAVFGAGMYSLKGRGVLHVMSRWAGIGKTHTSPPIVNETVPTIARTVPADASTGADPDAPIRVLLDLPNGPLDPKTITDDAVGLFRFDNAQRVPAHVVVDGNALVVRPLKPLEANRNYRVHVVPGIVDRAGKPLMQKSFAFFTSSQPLPGVGYDHVPLLSTQGEGYTCLNFGPDGKLYAATHDGKILRFAVNADGTLGTAESFKAIQAAEHGPRLMTGFTFDPRSTADNPVIYLTHSEFGFGQNGPVTDFTGKIARLSGPALDKVETLVFDLPRSARDHATNQPKFGPDGALYVPQPSNTATGGPDAFWFQRHEHGLNATVLRLDVDAMAPGQTIDAKTIDAGGPFDPHATGSPLSVFANGLRMPYDLLFHSNGHLYASINGAARSGSTPGGAGVPVIPFVNLAEHDWLFDVKKDHYYGHPNDTQGHYVLNGGNPTAAPDFNEVSDYPVGTRPDSQWTPAIFDYGMHVSADGMVEIRGDRFPALKGKVFVCRYNIGSGLLCLGFDADGKVNYATAGIPGTSKLTGPLDVTEDVRTGNLYVCEYFERAPAETRITLLRATDSPVEVKSGVPEGPRNEVKEAENEPIENR